MKTPVLSFETASRTDKGMVRSNNEDSLFVIDDREQVSSRFSSFGLYVIADGMGGHKGGEIASKIATRVVSKTLLDNLALIDEIQDPFSLVKEAIKKANAEILKIAGTSKELNSMGTTLTMGLRLDNELYIGHVGDSRAYLVRGLEIHQLTRDHSLIACLLEEGTITHEDALTHPDKNVILRCLGMSDNVDVDSYYQDGKEKKLILKNRDCLIFCSDGLTYHITDKEIFNILKTSAKADQVCEALIHLANSSGGEDNISVIIVKAKPDTETT